MSLKELAKLAGVICGYLSDAARGRKCMSPKVQARTKIATTVAMAVPMLINSCILIPPPNKFGPSLKQFCQAILLHLGKQHQ